VEVLELRRAWLIPAAVLLGVLVGLAVSLVSSTSREAEAQVLISSPRGTSAVTPFLPNLRELAKSGVLAGNVRSTLRLKESTAELRDHLDAEVAPQSQVIVISATDDDADKARQIAQEAAVVFTQLVQSRFGQRSPPLQAALTDSAQVLSEPNRHFVRNALIGGVLGLVLGLLTALLLQGGRVGEGAGDLPEGAVRALRKRESQVEERVKIVSAREYELAKRAGQLASRERELDKRASELVAREAELSKQGKELVAKERELESRPALEPPVPEPVLSPEPGTPVPVTPGGVWNIFDLEHAVEEQENASPEQAEEWRAYLYFLREHASADGTLPRSFEPLISEVFVELMDRRPSS
jgi:capsular polysaccharide biosynthesis protein